MPMMYIMRMPDRIHFKPDHDFDLANSITFIISTM